MTKAPSDSSDFSNFPSVPKSGTDLNSLGAYATLRAGLEQSFQDYDFSDLTPRQALAAHLEIEEDKIPSFDVNKLMQGSDGPDCSDKQLQRCKALLYRALTNDAQMQHGIEDPSQVKEAKEATKTMFEDLLTPEMMQEMSDMDEKFAGTTLPADVPDGDPLTNPEAWSEWGDGMVDEKTKEWSKDVPALLRVQMQDFLMGKSQDIPFELLGTLKASGHLDSTEEADTKKKTLQLIAVIDIALGAADTETFARAMHILQDLNPSAYGAITCLSGAKGMMLTANIDALGRLADQGIGNMGNMGQEAFLILGLAMFDHTKDPRNFSVAQLLRGEAPGDDIRGGLTGDLYFEKRDPQLDYAGVVETVGVGVAAIGLGYVMYKDYQDEQKEITKEADEIVAKLTEKIENGSEYTKWLEERRNEANALANSNDWKWNRQDALESLRNTVANGPGQGTGSGQGSTSSGQGSTGSDTGEQFVPIPLEGPVREGSTPPPTPVGPINPKDGFGEENDPFVPPALKPSGLLGSGLGTGGSGSESQNPEDALWEQLSQSAQKGPPFSFKDDPKGWILTIFDRPEEFEHILYGMFIAELEQKSRDSKFDGLPHPDYVHYTEEEWQRNTQEETPWPLDNMMFQPINSFDPQMGDCGEVDPDPAVDMGQDADVTSIL